MQPSSHEQLCGRLQALVASPTTQVSWHAANGTSDAPKARTFLAALAITSAALMGTGAVQAQSRTTHQVWLASLERPPVEVTLSGRSYLAPHPLTRYLMSKRAADDLKLESVGLNWKHVYAMAEAESSWVERDGMGDNGRVSIGIAQMEEPTAKALGIDPRDQQQALVGIASLAKSALQWAQARGADPKLALSIYYNLSTKGRQAWDGRSTDGLPQATLNHIQNVEQGLLVADRIEAGIRALQRQRAAAVAKEIQARSSEPQLAQADSQSPQLQRGDGMKDPETQRHKDAIGFGQMSAVARDLLDRARRISAQQLDHALDAARLTPAQREAMRSSLRAQSFPAVSLMRQAVQAMRGIGERAAQAMADLGKSVDVSATQLRAQAAMASVPAGGVFTLPPAATQKTPGSGQVGSSLRARVESALAHLRDTSTQARLMDAGANEPSVQTQIAQHGAWMNERLQALQRTESERMRGG